MTDTDRPLSVLRSAILVAADFCKLHFSMDACSDLERVANLSVKMTQNV